MSKHITPDWTPPNSDWKPSRPGWRRTLHEIIFEAESPESKGFDVVLLWAILISVAAVMLESVGYLQARFQDFFIALEWAFTLLFTVEYILRLLTVEKPWRYATSFFGVVDLLSIIPTYLSLFITGTHYLMVIRTLRLLRVFRVLKLVRFMGEAQQLMLALKASREKVTVFLLSVLSLVTILGTVMYVIEGGENGFTSIPKSIYWAVVTLTTVGYGDIAPQTVIGQALSSFIMIMGYAILAVPTGIVTVELANLQEESQPTLKHSDLPSACPQCEGRSVEVGARYCKYCGLNFTEWAQSRQGS